MDTKREVLIIRQAYLGDAEVLSDIAFRSKAHWGYDQTFMEACRNDLTVTTQAVARQPYYLVEHCGRPVGFYNVGETEQGVYLQNLFVVPETMGKGFGKALWRHMLQEVREKGYRRILIDSDPYAEPFYIAMGARRIGLTPSSVFEGRYLPLLRYDFIDHHSDA